MFSPLIKKSFTVAAAGSAWVATASTSFAEKKTKLSIYDDPEPQVVIVESPTKLETQVHIAQKYANETLNEGKTRVDGLVQQYKDIEHQVTSDISSTIDKDEELFPNLFYVGVAALGGTILARNRNIVLRFLTSTALAVGTSYYFLPKTTHNVAVRLETFEKRFPQLVKVHQQVNETVGDARKQVEGTVAQLRGAVDENTNKLRQQIQLNKQETQQKVKEVEGEAKEKAKQVEEKVKQAESGAEEKFDQVKKNVESMYTTRSKPGVDETLKKEN